MNNAVPNVVQISLTNRCQCNCRYCGVSFLRKKFKKEMTFGEIERIFNELQIVGCRNIDLFGGEPTLRKDIFDIIRLGKECGFFMCLETNGLRLESGFVKNLKKAGINLIYLNFNSHTEEGYDDKMRCPGAYKAAVRAIENCKKHGIAIHTTLVPENKEYFSSGKINEYVDFCLKKGAEKVRVLFPSCVGNWSVAEKIRFTEKEEREVFKYVDKKFLKKVYVEAENGIKTGEKTVCSAMTEFCHITPTGLMMPCPYLPFVFGDAKRESILSIFGRIRSHSYMNQSGGHCPSREKKIVNKYLKDLSVENPYAVVKCENKIDIGARCNNNCRNCDSLPERQKPANSILKSIKSIDRHYKTVDLYGGEPFVRKDIFKIIDAIPKSLGINLYTNGRAFAYRSLAEKIKEYEINSVKIPFFSLDEKKFDGITGVGGSYGQTVKGIRNLCREKIPVCIYVPEGTDREACVDFFVPMGVASISSYKKSAVDPLPDSVLCFGKKIYRNTLIWLNTGGAGR